MAAEEMEARLGALSQQVAMLLQQRDEQRKHWLRCSFFAFGAAVLFAVLTLSGSILGIASGTSLPITQIFGLTMTISLFLGIAFSRAAATLADRPAGG